MQAEVWQIWVAIGVARSDRSAGEAGSAKIVRVVAAVCAVEVVVVGGLEGVRASASVHCSFVYAAESLVCSDALADVESIES